MNIEQVVQIRETHGTILSGELIFVMLQAYRIRLFQVAASAEVKLGVRDDENNKCVGFL